MGLLLEVKVDRSTPKAPGSSGIKSKGACRGRKLQATSSSKLEVQMAAMPSVQNSHHHHDGSARSAQLSFFNFSRLPVETLGFIAVAIIYRGHSSVGRASALQAEGLRFESACLHQFLLVDHVSLVSSGSVAQLVRAPP